MMMVVGEEDVVEVIATDMMVTVADMADPQPVGTSGPSGYGIPPRFSRWCCGAFVIHFSVDRALTTDYSLLTTA